MTEWNPVVFEKSELQYPGKSIIFAPVRLHRSENELFH